MRYVGGKSKIAKDIVSVIREHTDASVVYEPFMGGGAITEKLAQAFQEVHAADAHQDLVYMWSAVKEGWKPPTEVSETQYEALRHSSPSVLRGFVGSGGSFGGKWFGGFARGGVNADGTPRNHQAESARSVLKTARHLGNVHIFHRGYDLTPIVSGTAIYCDPPYADTLGYASEFNSDSFWRWAEDASRTADVFVSEYRAPEGWECLWSKDKRQSVTRPEQGREIRTEKLFTFKG